MCSTCSLKSFATSFFDKSGIKYEEEMHTAQPLNFYEFCIYVYSLLDGLNVMSPYYPNT